MEKSIVDGNRLIAEFMGGELMEDRRGNVYWFKNHHHVLVAHKAINVFAFKYHSSWDWLMPVVEKIERNGFIVEMWLSLGKGCRIFRPNYEPSISFSNESNSMIEAVYLTAAEAIEWYNSQSKP